MGHARALLSVTDSQMQTKILNEILKNELSVRRIEEYARNYSGKKSQKPKGKGQKKTASVLSFEEQKLEEDLSAHFNTDVRIEKQNNGSGKIVISYKTDNDLKRISRFLDI